MEQEETNNIESIRNEAQAAKEQAEKEFQSSEYPRLGKAVYTELSDALENLATTLERPAETPRTDSPFEIRRAARITRLRNRAAYLKVEAARRDCQSHDIGRNIPFGQPILVGHHSERGHRNAIEKMQNASRRSIELNQEARDTERAAWAAETNNAIFSDDPEAIRKLKEKLKNLEGARDDYKAANRLVRKNDREGIKALGYSDMTIDRMFNPQFGNAPGIPTWQITNLGAEIRRTKERVAVLEKEQSRTEESRVSIETDAFKCFEDATENRICFSFPGKPAREIIDALKSHGFKWSPSRGLWVRMLNDSARWAAKHAIAEFNNGGI